MPTTRASHVKGRHVKNLNRSNLNRFTGGVSKKNLYNINRFLRLNFRTDLI